MCEVAIKFPPHQALPDGYKVEWWEADERFHWVIDENQYSVPFTDKWQAYGSAWKHSNALKKIAAEIETKHNCKVLTITYAQLLSLCVRVKIQFSEDFLYKPFDELPKPETIVFSERTITFFKRVDLFDCINSNKQNESKNEKDTKGTRQT